jgi:hypothetical protein
MGNFQNVTLLLSWIGIACWGICFWWMHRISSRQDAMLKEMHEMMARIEHLSKREHDLIQEVHPAVSEIKESVKGVVDAVSEDHAADKRG